MAGTDKKQRNLSDSDTPHTRVEEESDVEKLYTLGNILGQGTFGTVLEATNKCSGQQYAMKIVNKDKVGARSYIHESVALQCYFNTSGLYCCQYM